MIKVAASGNGNDGGSSGVSWGTLTQTGMFILVIVGSFWALAFGPIQEKFVQLEKRDVAATQDVKRINAELREEVRRIDAELLQRRTEFVGQPEFHQFQLRLESLSQRILLLEQSRPTTGELAAMGKGSDILTAQLERRVQVLESIIVRKSN